MANNNDNKIDANNDAENAGTSSNADNQGPQKTQIPSWVVPSLFEATFKQICTNYKQIKDFRVHEPLAAGENYATLMLRLEAVIELTDGTTTTKTLMLKVAHTSPTHQDMLKHYDFFVYETSVYRDIIPELEQMYKDVGLNIKFGPNFYQLNINERHVLLEDLSQRQFKNLNRLEGLDEYHTKEVLTKMAQWHAATATRAAKKGPYPKKFIEGFFTGTGLEKMRDYFNNLTPYFMENINQYEGHKEYLSDLNKLIENLVKELYKVGTNTNDTNDINDDFNVLNHGDFWSNNVMFRHDDEGNVRETYLVDYQMIKYGTPAQDLYYFLLSSTNYEMKLSKFDYFIAYYHRQLVKYLKLLKYPNKKPTLKEIHIQLYKNGIWGVNIVIGVMGAVLLESTKDACMENILGTSPNAIKFKKEMYANERYRQHAQAILPWLYYRGLFETS